jgi:hypothetical protein
MRRVRRNRNGRLAARAPPRFGSLVWNDQATLAEAAPVHCAANSSRPDPGRVVPSHQAIVKSRSPASAKREAKPNVKRAECNNRAFGETALDFRFHCNRRGRARR